MAIVGIDLGTTNSLVSVWKDGKCEVIPNSLGDYLTASIVAVDKENNIVVGGLAKEIFLSIPRNGVSEFKRYMGTNGKFRFAKRKYTATELSALVLKKLKEDAEHYLGEPVMEAVISVPAYFNAVQRYQTKQAGEMAGLKVEKILNEPSAAALAYRSASRKEDELFIVVDFGGGTLDISVVDAFDDMIEILSITGNNHLGGMDIDELIMDAFLTAHELDAGFLSEEEKSELKKCAEWLKRSLSKVDREILSFTHEGYTYEMEMTMSDLEKIIRPVLGSMTSLIEKALRDSEHVWEDVDAVLMVGGTSKMPIVKEHINKISGNKVRDYIDPDKAITIGVGTYAGIKMRTEDIKDMVLTDVCPFSLGIAHWGDEENGDGIMIPVIKRNTNLPVSRTKRYYVEDLVFRNHTFTIMQGDDRLAYKNDWIGKIKVPLPKNRTQPEAIDVRFSYDIDGILEVEATVVSTGVVVSKIITEKALHFEKEEIEEKRELFSQIQFHPAQEERNQVLMIKGERLYEETSGNARKLVEELIQKFTEALETQDKRVIEKVYQEVDECMDIIDNTPRNLLPAIMAKYMNEDWGEEA